MSWIVLSDLRGGRNGADSPIDPTFPTQQVVEAFNIDYDECATLGCKRNGASPISMTGGTAFNAIVSLIRHVPTTEALAELWAIDANGLTKRKIGAAAWAAVTVADTIGADGVSGVTFNGKLYLAYNSTVDRLHVWDENMATPGVRKVGLIAPAVPTVANQGAGAYAAVQRYYRIRWIQMNVANTALVRRSEPSPSVAFTPSGAGASVRITRPALPGESETHWEIEISPNNADWYRVYCFRADVALQIPVATTFQDDLVVAASYIQAQVADVLGTYALLPSVKFLITDNNRLIGAGAWESAGANSGGKTSRVWYTPVLGSLNRADDERLNDTVDLNPYSDLNEKDGGEITGLGGPMPNGIIYAFKYRQVWRGTPTGDDAKPYSWRCITRVIGSINHASIVLGEDHVGQPALYFLSHLGPYRVVSSGFEYLGRDIEDIWYGQGDGSGDGTPLGLGVDPRVPVSELVPHGVYHSDKKRVEWYLPIIGYPVTPRVNAGAYIRLCLYVRNVIHVDKYGVRGGWVYHSPQYAGIDPLCSCMFQDLGGTSLPMLRPHIGLNIFGGVTVGIVLKTDDPSDGDDNGVDFQSYITTRSLTTAEQLGSNFGIRETILIAKPETGVTIQQTIIADFGLETQLSTVLLTAAGSETRVIRKFEGSSDSDMGVMQIRLGDAIAQEGEWHLEALLIPASEQGDKA